MQTKRIKNRNWSYRETEDFLDICHEENLISKLKTMRTFDVFRLIGEKMVERGLTRFDYDQMKIKWTKLRGRHSAVVSGREDGMGLPFFNKIDAIIKQKPLNNKKTPPKVKTRSTARVNIKNENDDAEEEDVNEKYGDQEVEITDYKDLSEAGSEREYALFDEEEEMADHDSNSGAATNHNNESAEKESSIVEEIEVEEYQPHSDPTVADPSLAQVLECFSNTMRHILEHERIKSMEMMKTLQRENQVFLRGMQERNEAFLTKMMRQNPLTPRPSAQLPPTTSAPRSTVYKGAIFNRNSTLGSKQ